MPSKVIIKQSPDTINAQHMALAIDKADRHPNGLTEAEYALRTTLPVF